MGVMEDLLIRRLKQSRDRNASTRRGQLGRIRGAVPGQTGDDLCSRRCIVTNGNLIPGYRHEQAAVGMDSHQKAQNGRDDDSCSGDCRNSGHSLMSLVPFFLLAMALIIPQCSASDPCSESINVEDGWRDVSNTQGTTADKCDQNRFDTDKWYSFRLRNSPATIPTECIKNNICGSKIGMRVDLNGQSLPTKVGENITAALCGSFDVLGKYDCCVLRMDVHITRCENDKFVYNFPTSFDRCPVAVCAHSDHVQVPPESIAKMGEDVNTADAPDITDTTMKDDVTTKSEDATKAAAEDTTEAATKDVTEPATEDVTEAATKDVTEVTTEYVTEAATEDVTEAATEAATEDVTEAATEYVTEAATEDVTEAATEYVTEAATEDVTEAATDVTETATEVVTKAAIENVTEAAKVDVTEDITEAATEDVTEAATEDATVSDDANDTTAEPDVTTEIDLPPPQLLMHTTTAATASADSTTEAHTTTTDLQLTSTLEDSPTETSNKEEPVSKNEVDNKTLNLVTEPVSVTEQVTDSVNLSTVEDYSTHLHKDTFPPVRATTHSLQTTLETDTSDITVTTGSKESTSDTSTLVSRLETDTPSTTDEPSIYPSSTPITSSSELLSTSIELPEERLSTSAKSSTNPSTSLKVDYGSDTTMTTTLEDISETTVAPSSSDLPSETSVKSVTFIPSSPSTGIDVTRETAKPLTSTAKSTFSLSTSETKIARSLSTSKSTTSDTPQATRGVTGDLTITEHVRFVFKGNESSVVPASTFVTLLNTFLTTVSEERQSKDDSIWSHDLGEVTGPVNFENRKTYMDLTITHTSTTFIEISNIFNSYGLKKFISENSNMILLAECRVTKNCQLDTYEGTPAASVFENNAPAFITVIILCSICLLVLILALLYYRLSKRGSWKASPDNNAGVLPDNRHYISGNQSPFTDAQIMKDEMLDDASFNGSAKDGDTNLTSTWVIPLDQEPSSEKIEIAIATEDTQF